jgi:hypothetical protein
MNMYNTGTMTTHIYEIIDASVAHWRLSTFGSYAVVVRLPALVRSKYTRWSNKVLETQYNLQ